MNITRALNVLAFAATLLASQNSYAVAWPAGKGKSQLTTSFFYSPQYGYKQEDYAEDTVPNSIDYSFNNKIWYDGISALYEYGLTNMTTVTAGMELYNFNDKYVFKGLYNDTTSYTFSDEINYYKLHPFFSLKQSFTPDDFSSIGVELGSYTGDLVFRDEAKYIPQSAAGWLGLSYGRSFNFPSWMANYHDYGNYFEIEAGYKPYFKGWHNESEINASVGLSPFKAPLTFILGMYNTFNGYSYDYRPYDLKLFDQKAAALGLSAPLTNAIKETGYKNFTSGNSGNFHQVNFQVAYDLTKTQTLYLQSFHNVIKEKPFKYNSYYLSLESKF